MSGKRGAQAVAERRWHANLSTGDPALERQESDKLNAYYDEVQRLQGIRQESTNTRLTSRLVRRSPRVNGCSIRDAIKHMCQAPADSNTSPLISRNAESDGQRHGPRSQPSERRQSDR